MPLGSGALPANFRDGAHSGSRRSVSGPSSNRTYGSPVSGSQSQSRLRPRKVSGLRYKAREAVGVPQPLVGEARVSPRPHLVLPPEPLSQPPGRLPIHRLVGRADLPEVKVVCPPRYHPVQESYHCLGFQPHIVRGPSTEVLQFMSLPPCTASAATGWNDTCRAGFAPARKVRLSTAYRAGAITPAETSRCSRRSLPDRSTAFPWYREGQLPHYLLRWSGRPTYTGRNHRRSWLRRTHTGCVPVHERRRFYGQSGQLPASASTSAKRVLSARRTGQLRTVSWTVLRRKLTRSEGATRSSPGNPPAAS